MLTVFTFESSDQELEQRMIWIWIPLVFPVTLLVLAMFDRTDKNEWVH
jgi:hypothetical protein